MGTHIFHSSHSLAGHSSEWVRGILRWNLNPNNPIHEQTTFVWYMSLHNHNSLIEQHNVRQPDLLWRHSDRFDATVGPRIPLHLVVIPFLKVNRIVLAIIAVIIGFALKAMRAAWLAKIFHIFRASWNTTQTKSFQRYSELLCLFSLGLNGLNSLAPLQFALQWTVQMPMVHVSNEFT